MLKDANGENMHITIAKYCRSDEASGDDSNESKDNSDNNDNSDSNDNSDANDNSDSNDNEDSKDDSVEPAGDGPIDWRTKGNVNEPEN